MQTVLEGMTEFLMESCPYCRGTGRGAWRSACWACGGARSIRVGVCPACGRRAEYLLDRTYGPGWRHRSADDEAACDGFRRDRTEADPLVS